MGTAMRTRQGTAAQPVIGVGAMTEVQVSDRPTTMQGLSGMKTGSLGPKRQIYDKSYYQVELRKRCQELTTEVANMHKEIQNIQTDNRLYSDLEKRYDSLVKMVRSLEGDLADNNLASDKQRTGTAPEEVHHMYMVMKSQNDQQREEVDQIFLEKRSHEEEIHRLDAELEAIARSVEERLTELHPDQRREYQELQAESNRLGAENADARGQLEKVNERLDVCEAAMRDDPLRMHYQHLSSVRQEFESQLEQYRAEVQQASLSVPEQREILLAKVKSDNGDIVATEKSNLELKNDNVRLKALIREVQNDAAEKKDEGGDQQKYEILFTKDQEMTAFIDGFDASKAEEEQKLKNTQEKIEQLLMNISMTVALPQDVTPEGQLRDMEDELDFKSKQLQNSETTQHRLEGELSKRESELEKIESLDVKISQELAQVEEKMKQYESDMVNKYDNIEGMRSQGDEQLKSLVESHKLLQERAAASRQHVNMLKLQLDSKHQQLKDNEAAANLEAQEQKIRQFGQTLHTLRSFIQQKGAESNFDTEYRVCSDIAVQLNTMLV